MDPRSRHVAGIAVRVALAVLLVATILLSTPRPSAAVFPRHTIVGKLFRMTPAGHIYSHFETRKIEYDQAQQWLDERIAEANQRDAVLKELLRMRAIDGHTYIQARSLNTLRRSEYVEIKDRMTRITRDSFHRAMGQEVVDRLVPRILAHHKFNETLGEINEAFETTRGFLEDGVLRIDQLAAKADLGFLDKAREAAQRLIARIDKKELTGALLAPVRQELERLDGQLAQLQKDLPDLAKPEEVKRLQEEARQAVKSLQSTQDSLNQAVQRVRDQGTVVIPVRSAARDKVIEEKLEAFRTDQNMTQNAVATALGRGAEQRRVNAAIDEAMDHLSIDRSDLTYIRLRKLATGILAAQGIDLAKLGDDELVRVWREALAEAQGRYEKAEAAKEEPTPEGPILLHATAANLIPNIRWTTFAQEMTGRDDCAFRELRMAEAADSLWLELAFELGDATFSGSFSGSMVCKQPPCGQGYTEFSCSFRGEVVEPEQTLVYPDTATGLWKFSGPIDITLSCEGKTVCENRTGPNGEEQITWAEGSRSNVRLRGQISGTAEPGGKATVHVGPPGGTFGEYDGGWWFSLWQGGEGAGRAAIDSDFPPLPTW